MDDVMNRDLTQAELAEFKRPSAREREGLREAVQRKLGRPPKDPSEKEKPRSIRMSDPLVEQLKQRASAEGYAGWQSFAKRVLADYLKKPPRRRVS